MLGTVFAKTLRDQRRGLMGWGVGIVANVVLMAAIWPSFSDVDYESLLEQYPEGLKDVFNIDEMSTAAGFLNGELYSLVLPAVFIIDDPPVPQIEHTVEVPPVPVLVRDHHDGLAKFAVEVPDQVEDQDRVLRVEVGAGLVGEEKGGVVHERPGDRHPLLLPP